MIRTTEPAQRFGWIGPDEARRAFDGLAEHFPRFAIAGPMETAERKRVVLWEPARQANGGRHLPTLRQQRGSCVGHGAANAVWYLAAFEVVRLRQPERVVMPYEPFIYGTSRVQVGGGRIDGDGSLGVWAAQAVRTAGVLRSDLDRLPAWEETKTPDGSIACVSFPSAVDLEWGRPPGPPTSHLDKARSHLVRTTAKVRSYEEVRDALANGYPVTVASMQGFLMAPRLERGKHWGVPRGKWAHQMCFVGVDDDPARPGCYCLNSWGPDAHGPPAGDEPPGGFWVDAATVDRMARTGDDAFAFSQFDGFPAQRLDFRVV